MVLNIHTLLIHALTFDLVLKLLNKCLNLIDKLLRDCVVKSKKNNKTFKNPTKRYRCAETFF